jgi:two-component system NarL family response regulator
MADRLRVCVQQRQRLLREGLGQLLEAQDDIEVAATVVNADELPGLCDELRPNVVLLEVEGGGWDPSRLASRLTRRASGLRLLGLYVSAVPANARQIRQCGIRLVSHQGGIAPILRAVRGGAIELNGASAAVATSAEDKGPSALTAREVMVLTLIGGGFTTREISAQLAISHKTVENHKQRIFGKLGVQNQAHAVSIAVRRGMISPERSLELAVAR